MAVSRLYRKLKPTQPLFQFYNSGTGTYNDTRITSMTVTRGSASAEPDLPVNTAEATITGEATNIIGARTRINLTGYGADLVAGMAGNITREQIQERFWGRTGIVSIDDYKPTKKLTTVTSASWMAMLKKSNYDPFISAGWRTGLVIHNSLNFPNLGDMYTPKVYGVFDRLVESTPSEESRNFVNVAARYGTDLGLRIREIPGKREVQIWTIQARKDEIRKMAATAPHLTRSAAISPAKHSQTLDSWNQSPRILTRLPSGNTETIVIPPRTDRTFLEVKEIDLSYVYRDTEQIAQHAKALEARTLDVVIRPESITVDLLYLLTSPSEHHRHQAGYLLALQPQDPVFFSGDWHPYLQGMYTAEQIKETITPDTWTLELSLYPAKYTLGDSMEEVWPKPQTWEAAGEMRWSDFETEKWNDL